MAERRFGSDSSDDDCEITDLTGQPDAQPIVIAGKESDRALPLAFVYNFLFCRRPNYSTCRHVLSG
jgi:hypothetical protein